MNDTDPPLPLSDILRIDNYRVRRLLFYAHMGGLEVHQSASTRECWSVTRPGERYGSITLDVFGEGTQRAEVMFDDPARGCGYHSITQRAARTVIDEMAGEIEK